ncbi:unnamed protein product [Lupinus luteus]|uniref:Uncharacterized protein n=1 Tax=Lupinus luteus TaxID=3873 RepID=A0AAV1W7G5_LUPLU
MKLPGGYEESDSRWVTLVLAGGIIHSCGGLKNVQTRIWIAYKLGNRIKEYYRVLNVA